MTPQKLTGFNRFVCFVIAAIIVILIIGFVASGRQNDENPDSGDVGNSTDDTDQGNIYDSTINADNTLTPQDKEGETGTDTPPVVYVNPLTGLQVSESRYNSTPSAIVIDPSSPIYGISDADIALEIPIEHGSTRMLVYDSSEETLWKIGALMPTRKFISAITGFFGGLIIANGEDDKIAYDTFSPASPIIDISKYSDCFYVENTKYVYTSENMIESAKNKFSDIPNDYKYKNAPYDFYSDDNFLGTATATTIIIPFSEKNETELYYHQATESYIYYKSSSIKMDMLTGSNISYKNVFILFADTTTYEKSEGEQLVVNVNSGGKGYYASEGKYLEFTWNTDINGELEFYSLNGERLKVNPGNSYFAYYKSSSIQSVYLI